MQQSCICIYQRLIFIRINAGLDIKIKHNIHLLLVMIMNVQFAVSVHSMNIDSNLWYNWIWEWQLYAQIHTTERQVLNIKVLNIQLSITASLRWNKTHSLRVSPSEITRLIRLIIREVIWSFLKVWLITKVRLM